MPQECESRKMKVDEMYARMSAIPLKAVHKHIGLKAVGMAGWCWITKEINERLKERQKFRRGEGIHTEAYNIMNEELSRLTTEVKGGIWQRRVLEAKGTSEMWLVLKSLTNNKPNNITSIIIDNGRGCVSQPQNANAVMNMYKSVNSLNLTKEDHGAKRILYRTLRSLQVANDTWPGFTTGEV